MFVGALLVGACTCAKRTQDDVPIARAPVASSEPPAAPSAAPPIPEYVPLALPEHASEYSGDGVCVRVTRGAELAVYPYQVVVATRDFTLSCGVYVDVHGDGWRAGVCSAEAVEGTALMRATYARVYLLQGGRARVAVVPQGEHEAAEGMSWLVDQKVCSAHLG